MSENKLERRRTLDPAVGDLLGDMERKNAERKLPKRAREKITSERKRAGERLPGRVNYDLPPRLKAAIRAVAKRERVPESQLAALAVARLLADVEAGRVNLTEYKRPSNSPRFDWTLDLEEWE